MHLKLIAALCIAAGAGLGGCGITGNFRQHEGFVRFDGAAPIAAQRRLALSFGPLPLSIARAATAASEPEIAQLLRGVKGVRVYIYTLGERDEDARTRRRLERTRDRLVADGWDSVVAVRDDGESALALVRADSPTHVAGLVVMLQDHEEAVLINVIGDLKPQNFSALLTEFGLADQIPHVHLL